MQNLKDNLTETLGFSSKQINELIQICEHYDKQIQAKQAFNVREFEILIEKKFDIHYQSIKALINDFFICQKCLYLVYAFEYLNISGERATITSAYEKLAKGIKEEQEMRAVIEEVIAKSPKFVNNGKWK